MDEQSTIPRGGRAPRHGGRTVARRGGVLVAALVAMASVLLGVAPAAVAHPTTWGASSGGSLIGTWAATPLTPPGLDNTLGVPMTFTNQTLREIVYPHFSGPGTRITLSNRYGTTPVTFTDVRLGKQAPGATTISPGLPTVPTNVPGQLVGPQTLAGAVQGAAIVPGSNVPVTFGGSPSVTIPAGGTVSSDVSKYATTAFQPIAVSAFLSGTSATVTQHTIGNQVNYAAPGKMSDNATSAGFAPTGISYSFLSNVDVTNSTNASTVVALGDSLTDGLMSTVNANHRYPDYLAQGLASHNVSVINQGVAGQRLLYDNIGPSSLNSFGLNVAGAPRVRAIILQVGINDLANPPFIGVPGRHPEPITADQVIAGMKKFIDTARSRGIVVIGTTITPSGDVTRPARGLFETYSLPDVVAKRAAVNNWIRTSKYAPYIDFDKALLDPASPNSLRPDLASADNLHPNDKGYKVMADTALAFRP